jgi:hypothetical protein
MPEHRRQFSPQFKAEAVQMVIETGKPIAGHGPARLKRTGVIIGPAQAGTPGYCGVAFLGRDKELLRPA